MKTNITTAKSLADSGYAPVKQLAKEGFFPNGEARIISYRGREYALKDATTLRLREQEWLERDRFPMASELCDADGRFTLEQTEPVASRTEWNKHGMKLRDSAQAVGRKSYYRLRQGHITYEVYRASDTIAKRPKAQIADGQNLGTASLLDAIFAVNRAAKRRRDAACAQYEAGNHGFAEHQREKKTLLYVKKDRGIRAAIALGLLEFRGIHGRLAIWAGDGYRFHSTLAPSGTLVDDGQDHHLSEAKPKEAKELRILDACATIEAVAAPTAAELGLVTLSAPEFGRAASSYDGMDDEWDDEVLESEYE